MLDICKAENDHTDVAMAGTEALQVQLFATNLSICPAARATTLLLLRLPQVFTIRLVFIGLPGNPVQRNARPDPGKGRRCPCPS